MRSTQLGQFTGRALQEALTTCQQVWSQLEAVEGELAAAATPTVTTRNDVKYDPAIVRDFVANLPEWLQGDVTGGRKFLRYTLVRIQVADDERMPRICPVCGEAQGTINPQHMKTHGLTVEGTYRKYPGLGFSKKARPQMQPSPAGLLRDTQVFALVVAGAGFEPATFGL